MAPAVRIPFVLHARPVMYKSLLPGILLPNSSVRQQAGESFLIIPLSDRLIPPFSVITALTAWLNASSLVPTATILWLSWATEEARAPDFKPKFLIKALAIGAFL